jgi:hypothetical protein
MAIITLNNNSLSSVTSLPAAIDVGALVKITSTSISGSPTNVDFTDVFSSTYKNYFVIGSNINAASNSVEFRMQIGLSSSFEGASYKCSSTTSNAAYNGSSSGGTPKYSTGRFIMNESTQSSGAGENDMSFSMYVYNPQVSGVNTNIQGMSVMMQQDGGYMIAHRFNGTIENTAQFTDYRFHWSSGNFSNTGQITFYGVKE